MLQCLRRLHQRASQLPAGLQQLRHYQLGDKELEPWDWADSPIERARTPPKSWYTSPAVEELEKEHVWGKSWQLAGILPSDSPVGTYQASTVGAGLPYLLVKQAQGGRLAAYHNACCHHGTQVAEGAGVAEDQQFRCPYHGWTYGLDGRLLKATRLKGIQDFRASEQGLKPMHAGEAAGMAFVNPSMQQVAPLHEFLGPALPLVQEHFTLQNMLPVHAEPFEVNCNWKVFADNFLDGGYHVPHAHKELASSLDGQSYSSTLHGPLSLQTVAPSAAAGDARLGNQLARYAFLWPNLFLNRYGDWLDINVVMPTSPVSCRVSFLWFIDQDSSRLEDETYMKEGIEASMRIQEEDTRLCERVQAGLRSPAFQHGRYAPGVETPAFHFHRMLHAALT